MEHMDNFSRMNSYLDEQAHAKAMQTFLAKTYAWMFLGLVITATFAFLFLSSDFIIEFYSNRMYFIFVLFAQLGLVFFLSSLIDRMSSLTAIISFIVYAALSGITFSSILLIYTGESVFETLIITSFMFAAMSGYGFVTKKDLNSIGRFLMMGLFGLIALIVLNFFVDLSSLNFLISCAGIIIFAGLAAYDTQKIKEMYALQFESQELATKGAIYGALTLYLDFVNLFLMLIRLTGRRN